MRLTSRWKKLEPYFSQTNRNKFLFIYVDNIVIMNDLKDSISKPVGLFEIIFIYWIRRQTNVEIYYVKPLDFHLGIKATLERI